MLDAEKSLNLFSRKWLQWHRFLTGPRIVSVLFSEWQTLAAINYNGGVVGNFAADTTTQTPVTESIDLSNGSVTAGTPELIFQTAQVVAPNTSGSLTFALAGAGISASQSYIVRLYFAEIDNTVDVGERSFDVSLEGDLVMDDYDPYAEVGAFTGVVKTFVITVDNDGTPDIDLNLTGIGPLISAIEIVSIS